MFITICIILLHSIRKWQSVIIGYPAKPAWPVIPACGRCYFHD